VANHGWIAGGGALRYLAVVLASAFAAPTAAQSVDRWNSNVEEASARFGIPADWISRVIQAESNGRTMLDGRPIVSRAGAMGLMQLMPETWRDMRALLGLGGDPYDPRDNILAGTAYLRAMYDRFGYPGLFAAYNAGPRRYTLHLSTGRRLPPETIAYVATVERAPIGARRSLAPAPQSTLFAVLTAPKAISADAAPEPAGRAPNALFVRLSGAPR
jgi:soluble lytic murein transglycosylase-like protein